MTKIALVIGGTSGVGLSIVKLLVKHNFKVYFIGRNQKMGQEIELELNQEKSNKAHFISVDISSLQEVIDFTKLFKKQEKQLDLLVNIAGIVLPKQVLTKEGFDKTFAVGYLSAFIFCNAFVPLLSAAKSARIINVGGNPNTVFKTRLDFNDLNFSKNYRGFKTTVATVHAKTVLTQIFAEHLSSKNIDVNSFHPGAVKSNLAQNMNPFLKAIFKVGKIFMASHSISGDFVCLSKEVSGTTGQLFVKKKPYPIPFNQHYKTKVWAATIALLHSKGLQFDCFPDKFLTVNTYKKTVV